MARPRKEGMDYFPHDTDAVNDEKIESLRLLYGNDGYAFYFILLERIYRTKEFELDVSDAETIQILSKKVGVNEEVFNKILETSLKRGCFDRQAYEERKVLTSEGIKKRSSVVVDKRVSMRSKYQKEKENVSDAETRVETPQSKVKESKEKKSIEKKNSRKQVYDNTSIYYQLAKRLFDRILENNSNYKEPNLQTWSNDIRLMMEKDNRNEEQIVYVIDWCQNHSFWKTNILSTSKLREKFDRLVIQIKEDKSKVTPIKPNYPREVDEDERSATTNPNRTGHVRLFK
ncbi:DUF4373 domain-containing protein [Metabacillus litoralis]|uniref:DUF4373 domain-containing protein n=1 Tax=Metabacillus litoralis TaxID=152268 RepID=UPI002040FF2D|nr:DUF4373 domain-containing protein [Metabacillus litoralis]MCM3651301.1 DUF4373 domain-containing protein [Metabacillus litoralis]